MTDTTMTTDAMPPKRSWRQNRIARVLIMFASLMGAYALPQIAGQIVLKKLPAADRDAAVAVTVGLGIILALWIYSWLVHRLENRRPIAELRASDAPLGLIEGLIIGIGIISAVIGVIKLMGDAVITLGTPPTLPFIMIAVAAISGVCEELIFRGALFRITEEMFGTLVALIISAALFGGGHIFNPHATWESSTAIAIEAGLLLGFAYTATRSLWLPIGLHAGWNLAEGGIYSTSVSGGKVINGVFVTTMKGPDIITGGGFGPEASVVAVGVCTVLTIVFAIVTFRRGEWKGLRLRIRAA
ncbi:MAG TPA: type II CAAX endopeptidase family protein [Rhizomicrobium sp.]|nr:type II CAAX endopeptidase family protein [Rhizomicrobium sp.]